MTSLLCQKSNAGVIVTADKTLCSRLLDDDPKAIPYLIKERKKSAIESSFGDEFNSYINSESNQELTTNKSNLTFKVPSNGDAKYFRNSVMFNIPSSNMSSQHSGQKKTTHTGENRLSTNHLNIHNRREINNVSSTIVSTVPTAHSSMSTVSMDKFGANNLSHEKKRICRKKLKHVQQQLENRLSVKSAHTIDLYKELNSIINNEKSLAQKINSRIETNEREKTRKREIIYKNWYRNVYEPMQNSIYNLMLSSEADYARNLRNLKYLEYLNQCNKRQSVYQDDFEPAEYDPVKLMNLDASLPCKLSDPTNLPRRKQSKETDLLQNDIRLPVIRKVSSPRSDIVWNNWILDQYNTIDSDVRAKSAKKCNSDRHSSEYNLEWDR